MMTNMNQHASRDLPTRGSGRSDRRGGAVIIIVLSLMAALAFLGFFYYEFTVLERSASGNFAELGVESAEDFDPTPYFDNALEQLIVGTRDTQPDSVLYGNKYSMLATLIGGLDPDGLIPDDLNPHNGGGIRVRFRDVDLDGVPDDFGNATPNGVPDQIQFLYGAGARLGTIAMPGDEFVFDNQDGFTSPAARRPIFNYSRVAQPSGVLDAISNGTIPNYQPDAGYTYPDVNSMFLGYEGQYQGVEIFIPSFFRPQYFQDRRISDSSIPNTFATLYRSNTDDEYTGDTRALVLRPHASHRRYSNGADNGGVPENGRNAAGVPQATPTARFLAVDATARSGDTSRTLPAFAFDGLAVPFERDVNQDGVINGTGVFHTDGTFQPWDLDVDTDNDGRNDAILMDLDMPIVSFDDGRQGVPLVSFKVLDADGLLNLNAHGNSLGLERVTRSRAFPKVPAVDPPVNHSQYPSVGPTLARNQALDVWASDRASRFFGARDSSVARPDNVSASALGQSPYEINPAYGLSAWAPTIYANTKSPWSNSSGLPHFNMFGDISNRPALGDTDAVHTELANMEFAMLLFGHTGGDGIQRISGRHGEANEQAAGLSPPMARLQPIVSRIGTSPQLNSIVPGAGTSYTNDNAVDDDGDHIQFDAWLDQFGDGLFDFNETNLNGDLTLNWDNARTAGDAYFPIEFRNRLMVPANVHPTSSVVVADPFTQPLQATPTQKLLDLAFGRNGLGADTGMRWPGYSHEERYWYHRNYPAIADGASSVLVGPPTINHAEFIRDWAKVAGILPYAASAMGLTGFSQNSATTGPGTTDGQAAARFTADREDYFDLCNEETEQVVGVANLSFANDALFDPAEMAALHLSPSDFARTSNVSRVRTLAPVNFSEDPEAESIRKRFTTESNDRLEMATMPNPVRAHEFRVWQFARPISGFGNSFGFTDGPAGRVNFTFPPVFGTAIPANDAAPPADEAAAVGLGSVLAFAIGSATNPADPFREVVRITLASSLEEFTLDGTTPNPLTQRNFGIFEADGTARLAARKKLRFDRIIDRIDPRTGEPVYRDLVPHPDLSAPQFSALTAGDITLSNLIPSHTSEARPVPTTLLSIEDGATPAAVATQQERLARQDRQDLARDIYVLLYTFCGPEVLDTTPGNPPTPWNPTTENPSAHPYGQEFVDIAAQLAVNIVDAFDRDSVITEFVYDRNLSDGWTADDATLRTAADGTPGAAAGIVNGVEAPSLMVSEMLLAKSRQQGSQDNDTSWDDTFSQQTMLIELRNVSPFDLELRNNSWRLEMIRDDVSGAGTESQAIEFRTAIGNTVEAGANYLIGETTAHDRTAIAVSASEVDGDPGLAPANAATNEEVILPKAFREGVVPITTGTLPGLDLDLTFATLTPATALSTEHADRFSTADSGGTQLGDISSAPSATDDGVFVRYAGTSASSEDVYDEGSSTVSLRLYRRRNLNDPNRVLGTAESDWLLVDRMHDTFDSVDFSGGNLKQVLEGAWRSTERAGMLGPDAKHATGTIRNHSLSTLEVDPTTRSTIADDRNPATPKDESVVTWGSPLPGQGVGQTATDISPPNLSGKQLIDKHQQNSNGNFVSWIPHFDRDMLSPSELLTIPLHGAIGYDDVDRTTVPTVASLPVVGPLAYIESNNRFAPESGAATNRRNVFESLLHPLYVTTNPARWFRLFDFVEVPPQVNDTLDKIEADTGTKQFRTRTPGRLNANTIRNAEVLAGLLDEPIHFDPLDGTGAEDTNLARFERNEDRIEGAARNWWDEFLRARDSVDAIAGVPLPGKPESRPFSPTSNLAEIDPRLAAEYSYVRTGRNYDGDLDGSGVASGFQVTPGDFRSNLPPANVGNRLDQMKLFEARTTTDFGTDAVDPWTRNRLLAKVMNNTTERSNVFVVWVAIQMHHADHGFDVNGNADFEDVRIGGVMDDMPVYRTFCVVDRSLLEQAYEDPDPTDGIPGTFDFRKFILHRQRLR